jgi:hypothetical protein
MGHNLPKGGRAGIRRLEAHQAAPLSAASAGIPPRSCPRSSGVSRCPCTATACCRAAFSSSASVGGDDGDRAVHLPREGAAVDELAPMAPSMIAAPGCQAPAIPGSMVLYRNRIACQGARSCFSAAVALEPRDRAQVTRLGAALGCSPGTSSPFMAGGGGASALGTIELCRGPDPRPGSV